MIVAEIGFNHKGSETVAARMLKALVKTCVDAVTFQIPPPDYYQKIKKWGGPLRLDFYKEAIYFTHKNKKRIAFCIGDESMISQLNTYGVDFWKTLGPDISNYSFQRQLQKTKKTVFASTAIAGEQEIVQVSRKFKNIIFIHTQLSHNIKDVNLRAIERLGKITKRQIAFGLHCSDKYVLYPAVAFDPAAIFFYVKERACGVYPDNEHAIPIAEVDIVAGRLKTLKKALGNGYKEKTGDMIDW